MNSKAFACTINFSRLWTKTKQLKRVFEVRKQNLTVRIKQERIQLSARTSSWLEGGGRVKGKGKGGEEGFKHHAVAVKLAVESERERELLRCVDCFFLCFDVSNVAQKHRYLAGWVVCDCRSQLYIFLLLDTGISVSLLF